MSKALLLPQDADDRLKIGWFIFRCESAEFYQIDAIDPVQQMIRAVNPDIQETIEVDILQLSDPQSFLVAPTRERLAHDLEVCQPLLEVISPAGLRESFLAKADFIISTVETIEELLKEEKRHNVKYNIPYKSAKDTRLLKNALSRLATPIGLTSYYKYRNLFNQYSGDRQQIAASMRRTTLDQSRMSLSQLHVIDTLIARYYVGPNRRRRSKLYEMLKDILHRTENRWVDPRLFRKGVPPNLIEDLFNDEIPFSAILNNPDYGNAFQVIELPSERWFYYYVDYVENQPDSGEHIITERYGKQEWENRFMVFETFVTQASRILQFVFADHWLVDAFILNDKDEPIRLWLTVLIDIYSRSVLGFALLDETPNIDSIQQALLHAIWPKNEILAQLGIQDPWVARGIPQRLFLDNAWAHHSHSLENLARIIARNGKYNAITLVFRPVYKGRYGAVIERLFGNFSDQGKQLLKGAIQSSKPQDVRKAKGNAVFKFADLEHFIYELIVRYQHTPHSALGGMTPHEKWLDSEQLGIPLFPKLTPEVERMFWRQYHNTRTITTKGISMFGLTYWSPELSGVRNLREKLDGTNEESENGVKTERVGKTGKVKYTIHYNKNDIARIAIFRNGTWIGDGLAKERQLPDGTTQPLSLAERHIAQQLARQAGKPARAWLQFTDKWQQLGEQRTKEKRKRQRAATPKSVAKNQPPPKTDVQRTDKPTDDNDYGDNYTDLLGSFVKR